MKKAITAVVSAALVCSMVSVVAFARTDDSTLSPLPSSNVPPLTRMQDDGFASQNLQDKSILDSATMRNEQAGQLEIIDPGTYVITGEMRGTVVVDPGQGDVELVMDGAALNGCGAPAIMIKSGDSCTIKAPEGSVNTITNGMGDPHGLPAIVSNIDVRFEGEGFICAPDDPRAGFRVEQNGMMQEFGPQPGCQIAGVPGEPGQSDPQQAPDNQMPGAPGNGQSDPQQAPDGQQPPAPGESGMVPGQQGLSSTTDSAGEIVTSSVENTAADLEADYENAIYITMTDENGQVKITSSGTYVVTGTCSDGNITVKKGTTGVILTLENLDLTSTTGATVSINKEAEVKIIISGEVVLTDNENPDDEYSSDEAVADAFDGAALKAKANSQVYVTGDGTLTINGNAKNGIKAGDDASLIIDGVTVNINAVNDGINANYDLTLLSGEFTISAGDDAIHADHILSIGSEDGTGPTINVTSSTEGLEGTVVNIFGGDISIVSSDDAINAANGDGTYEGELGYSFNMLGGKVVINSKGDGIDSNGNVNLIGGQATIRSAAGGGEAGIDYDGDLFVSDEFQLNNASGVAGPDMMGGAMGGMMAGMAPFGDDLPAQGPGPMDGQPQGRTHTR